MIHANGQKDRQIGRQTDIFTDRQTEKNQEIETFSRSLITYLYQTVSVIRKPHLFCMAITMTSKIHSFCSRYLQSILI